MPSIQWPTFAQTRGLTITVIAIALIVAVYLGVFDYAFSYLLGKILVV
jgi:preprotein translocase SecE subunit